MTVGIVIAAGMGSRMVEITSGPKCMLPIAGRPLLHHTIDRLREIGCDKIVVIVGHNAAQISASDCVFVENPEFKTNNILHSLMSAREHIKGQVICSYSDIWLEPEILSEIAANPGDIVAAVDMDWEPYYIDRSDHPLSEAENVFLDTDNSVRRIGKQLIPVEAGELKCGEFLGLWGMSPAGTARFVNLFEELEVTLTPSSPFQNAMEWQKAYITDLFQELVDRDERITSSLTQRRWAELDTRQDYERLPKIAKRQHLRTLMELQGSGDKWTKPTGANQILLKQLGARILNEANDLKRTPDALAEEMGVELDFVTGIIAGNRDIDQVRDFVWKMTEFYPISLADIWLDTNDTVDGAVIVRAADSAATSRIFERADGTGALSDYYEYRDTAMSRTAPFKPEWIREIRLVTDSDPDNPDVAFNNGHLMHQMTFFVGAVNFYWKVDGKKYCAEMSTGDSCFITPYVPHSFTRRNENEMGLIIAVTFAGEVRRAIPEIMRMGADCIEEIAGDLRDGSGYASRLKGALDAEMLTASELERQLKSGGIKDRRAAALASGETQPASGELETIAKILNFRPSDLMVPSLSADDLVTIRYASGTPLRDFSSGGNNCHQIRNLARSTLQPNIKSFDIHVTLGGERAFQHGLHEYVYNFGDSPVSLYWGEGDNHRDTLRPGDSAYFHPMTSHKFECETADGRLLCVRVPGRLNNDVLNEYGSFPKAIRQRVVEETMRWY